MANLQALWDDLNERQRAYLQALYACDQASETNGVSGQGAASTTALDLLTWALPQVV